MKNIAGKKDYEVMISTISQEEVPTKEKCYRLNTGVRNKWNEGTYLTDKNLTTYMTKNELLKFIKLNLGSIATTARKDNMKCFVEKDNQPVNDEDFTKYLEQINITDYEIEAERRKRIKMLHLETLATKDMIENKAFWVSENTGLPFNVNYSLEGYSYEKEVKTAINKITAYGGIPYFAIVDHLKEGGLWVSVLYISLHKKEWDYERVNANNIIASAVYNTNFEMVDYGDIQIKIDKWAGSVRRTA